MDKERWDRVGTLFSRAVSLGPEERHDFLDEACGDDKTLRQELESLLSAHGNVDEAFLDGLDADFVAGILDGEAAPEQIGPWRVEGEIGRGGMGVVYRARRDDGQFDQQVALKLIKRGMDSDRIQQRFLRERQILAAMDHPGIARLLDGGVTEEGRPWFALELVEGVTLTEYCEERRLGAEARLRLFAEACHAVEYAHRNLVVHRDLKPSNILVDPTGRVKLLDFGIAKLLSDEGSSSETRTEAEGRLMTPGYGAPELVLGGQITTATDVYSLGIILYELLAGKLPYEFKSRDVALQALALADSKPPKLSALAMAKAGGAAVRGLGRELDTIAGKAIQAEPDRRYVTAAALRDDIERYLAGEPVLACPDSLAYRLRKLVQRHRTGVVAAALVALSLVVGLGVALWQADIAAQERDLARKEAEQTQEVKDFIIDLFYSTDPRDRAGEELTAERLLDRGLERVRTGLEDRPDLRLELLTAIGEASRLLGDFEKAVEVFSEALSIEVGPGARDQLRLAAALNGLGETYANLKDNAKAEEQHRRALAIRFNTAGYDNLDTAQTYNNLAVALADQRKLPEAIEMYGHALRIQERVKGETDPTTMVTMSNLGVAHRLEGNYPEAEAILREVVERLTAAEGPDHPYLIWNMSHLASVSRRLGNYVEAERLRRRSLDLSRKIWGDSHPTTRDMMNNYAMIAHTLGNDAEAVELMRKNLAMNLEQYGGDHPYISLNHDNLGIMLLELGRIEEAIENFETAEALHEKVSPHHYQVLGQIKHARARLASGEPERARDLVDRALAREQEHESPSRDRLMRILTVSGSVYGALGRSKEAADYFQRALAIHQELGSSDHPKAGVAHFGLGKLHLAEGRFERAGEALERAAEIWSRSLPEGHWQRAELLVTQGEYWIKAGDPSEGRRLLDQGVAQLEGDRGPDHWRTRAAIRLRQTLEGGSG